jgi:hypothetical protein
MKPYRNSNVYAIEPPPDSRASGLSWRGFLQRSQ